MTIQAVVSSRISVNIYHNSASHRTRPQSPYIMQYSSVLLPLPSPSALFSDALPTLRTPLTEITTLTSFCTAVTHTKCTCHRLPLAAPSWTKAEDSSHNAGFVFLDVSYEPNYTASHLKILNNDDMATRYPMLKLLAEQGHFV
jgi:hypothetical protein